MAATNDPVSSARFFKIIIDAFINHMIISGEEGGIFGPCDSYFATTEVSGRGALHFHCLVWITDNVGIYNLCSRIVSDPQFAALVIEYMEDMIQQSLNIIDSEEEESELLLERIVRPESAQFENDLARDSNLIAARFNMHTHTFSCKKYRTGSLSQCQFGAPWKVVERSCSDEDDTVRLKRNELYVNKWNPIMASSLRCNHDISFIPAQSGFLGLVYYITDYATKIAKLLYHYFLIAAALVPSRQSSNRDSPEDEESDSFKSRRFLTKVYNKTAIAREISGPEIANVMLGQPESYSNARFTTLNYNSLYSEMLTMFPHLRVERLVEDSREEPTVNIVDRNTAKDQFVNYKLRGSVLQRLCLYDYKSIVYTKVASEIEREKAQEEMDGCAHFYRVTSAIWSTDTAGI